jgi:hypothetical protein
MKITCFILLASLLTVSLFTFINTSSSAQSNLQDDDPYTMEIPQVAAMAGSAAHLYILSKTDGLIVFRSRKDSLKWLYTAHKMQNHAPSIRADGRFAYLFGDSLRLAVIDPTKSDQDFAHINLPSKPNDVIQYDVVRWKDQLYIPLGKNGLGKTNLRTISYQDSIEQRIQLSQFSNQSIIQIASSGDQLFVLSKKQVLFIFDKRKNGIHFKKKLSLPYHIRNIYEVNSTLMGSNRRGAIYKIQLDDSVQKIGSIGEPIQKIKKWKHWLIIKGSSSRLWVSNKFGKPKLWKRSSRAGNYFAISGGQLWLCQYNQINKVKKRDLQNLPQIGINRVKKLSFGPVLKLQPIKNRVIPYPHALVIPIKFKTTLSAENIQLHLKTSAVHAQVRGQSLYWKPGYKDKNKQYHFKIIASTPDGITSSTSFKVMVEPYNSPPRFVPLRTITIPSGHNYHLKIHAEDPDGSNKNLIRYLGVNLPKGASINAQTGNFQWKPTDQQSGKHEFRIIATDQYGAASYEDVTIRVLGAGQG